MDRLRAPRDAGFRDLKTFIVYVFLYGRHNDIQLSNFGLGRHSQIETIRAGINSLLVGPLFEEELRFVAVAEHAVFLVFFVDSFLFNSVLFLRYFL